MIVFIKNNNDVDDQKSPNLINIIVSLITIPVLQILPVLQLFEKSLSGGSAAFIFLYRDSLIKL